jgi:hypothetical protein
MAKRRRKPNRSRRVELLSVSSPLHAPVYAGNFSWRGDSKSKSKSAGFGEEYSGLPGQLNGVSCSKEGGFAVGYFDPSFPSGQHSSVEQSPMAGPHLLFAHQNPITPGELLGISAAGEWAVGWRFVPISNVRTLTLIYQRKGSTWAPVPGANVLASPDYWWFAGYQPDQSLHAVAGSARRAWAVGDYGDVIP